MDGEGFDTYLFDAGVGVTEVHWRQAAEVRRTGAACEYAEFERRVLYRLRDLGSEFQTLSVSQIQGVGAAGDAFPIAASGIQIQVFCFRAVWAGGEEAFTSALCFFLVNDKQALQSLPI